MTIKPEIMIEAAKKYEAQKKLSLYIDFLRKVDNDTAIKRLIKSSGVAITIATWKAPIKEIEKKEYSEIIMTADGLRLEGLSLSNTSYLEMAKMLFCNNFDPGEIEKEFWTDIQVLIDDANDE